MFLTFLNLRLGSGFHPFATAPLRQGPESKRLCAHDSNDQICYQGTGKSLSEALIFASTNPQYEVRLFIQLRVQYMKIPSSNLERTGCVQKLFLTFRTIFVHNMFSPCSAKRRASEKDLHV